MHGRSLTWCCTTALCLLAIASARADADAPDASVDDAALFAQVFKARPTAHRAPISLVIDGVEHGVIPMTVSPGDAPLAPSAPLLAALSPKLHAEAASALAAAARGPAISVAALRAEGFTVTYDPSKLELRIDVPPAFTRRVTHDLGAGLPAEAAHAQRPSTVSGYVNLMASATSAWAPDPGVGPRASARLNADATVNVDGWVVEGRGAVVTRDDGYTPITARRGDILASRDWPARALRFHAGDFAVPHAELQPGYPLLGLGVLRNFALQPYRVIQPIGAFDVVLERPAHVTVLVNGAVVQELALPAGRHDIRNLSIGAGINDVELLVKDAAGERRLAFATAGASDLLAPGLAQFSLSLGFPLLADAGHRSYDFTRPMISARRRWGATATVTAGGSFDGTFATQLAAGELTAASRVGTVSLDVAGSHDRDAGAGYAVGVRYDYLRARRGKAPNLVTIAGHHYAPAFRDLRVHALLAVPTDDVSITATRELARKIRARVNARYQWGRDRPDAHDASLAVSRSFGDVGIDATLGVRRGTNAASEARLFVTARWILPASRGSMLATSRTTGTSHRNELTYAARGSNTTGARPSVSLAEGTDGYGARGSLDLTGHRGTASIAASSTMGRDGGLAHTAAITGATALAFAGGRAAWSRPISGSFAIVERRAILDGIPIGVNPSGDGYAAKTDGSGLAVIPNLDAYRVGRIIVDAPTLPVGYSLGPTRRLLLPSYKSGTLVRVGEEGTVYLRGTLVRGRAPVALAVGEIRSLDAPNAAPLVLLTNRAGRFGLMGLKPGRYAIELADAGRAAGEIVIPTGFAGVYSAGVIEVR